ncbi:MAG: hypothetical protein PWQ97_1547 [Tepidanaerobacteraceae bacterium]|nr:hypothetical protein [Tepidanaerobacteraceae bacterium]
MFFIGIFGIQNKERLIKQFDNIICPACGRLSRAELMEYYTYFHFFFIPLFKWNRKYFLRLRCCGSLFEVEEEYTKEIIQGGEIDFDKLKKVGSAGGYCPNCGNFVNPGYNFCPYCGTKL